MQHVYGDKSTSVLIIGYFGYGNMGDEVCLLHALRALRCVGIRAYVAYNPAADSSALLCEGAIPINRRSPEALSRATRVCDGVFFLGGNHFENESSRRSLIYYSAIALAARKQNKPVYMLSSGLGKIRKGPDARLAASALRSFSFAGLRTAEDLDDAAALMRCTTVRMPDLAFLSETVRHRKQGYFAIVPRRDSALLLEDACALRAMGLRPVVIPFFAEEDMRAARGYGEALGCEVFFSREPHEVRKRLAEAEITLSERLHGAILSQLSSTPFILRKESLKCRRFTDEVGRVAASLGTRSPSLSGVFELGDFKARGGCDFDRINSVFARSLGRALGQAMSDFLRQ